MTTLSPGLPGYPGQKGDIGFKGHRGDPGSQVEYHSCFHLFLSGSPARLGEARLSILLLLTFASGDI